MLTETTHEILVACLTALRDEDRPKAAVLAGQAAKSGALLGVELSRHLDTGPEGHVYDQPAAFTAFIRGGGNVNLYEQLARRLASLYDDRRPESLLDLGCGDGLALVPALEKAAHRPSRIDLVEPSGALLEVAGERVDGAHAEQATAQEFLAGTDLSWDLVQSTFAMQSLEPDDRREVFRALRERTGELVLAEFDVPDVTEGSPEHLASLVVRYERGVAEYGHDDGLVAQGFLMPMLLGLVSPGGVRNNWEQPAEDWGKQLTAAGFGEVEITPLADYWWSPAVLIRAR
ncbi:class I SAM-dependent methyltransferase [Amycolatopsis sp. YIM 10]|uniref:class I SAM-dependent methyltransferase n=1 Tax=Amycolatopsis sp. YIM 10 TaxID=2653857 RepID=UPI001D157A30|nr:class I SAM-dependent methyltransferase [Amycolatopsis sp. YIM 10]